MTTWTKYPTTVPFVADHALNAGLANACEQQNCLSVIEQSGHDLVIMLSDDGGASPLSATITTSWTWVDEMVPEAIPVYQAHGGGWRELTLGLYATDSVDFDVRLYLLASPTPPSIDASTGDVDGVTAYAELKFTGHTWEWVEADATPEDTAWLEPDELDPTIGMPVVYMHMAAKRSSGSAAFSARAISITEAS